MNFNAADLDGLKFIRQLVEGATILYEMRPSGSTEFEDVFRDTLDDTYEPINVNENEDDRDARRSFLRTLKKSQRVLFQMITCIDEELDAKCLRNQVLVTSTAPLRVHFCSLPVEIISRIFEHVVLDDGSYDSALRLATINRRCREIATGLSSIWTILYDNFSPEKMALFLERSKSAMLSVHLSKYETDLEDFLERLKLVSDRIIHLEILMQWKLEGFAKGFSGVELRGLTSLRLMMAMEGFSSSVLSSVSMPNLTHYDGNWFYADEGSPWMSNITDCTFWFSVAAPELIAPGQIQLPQCETLRLKFRDSNDAYLMLPPEFPKPTAPYCQSSSLPKLLHLSIEIEVAVYVKFAETIVATCILTDQLRSLDIAIPNGLEIFPLQRLSSILRFRSLRSLKITEHPIPYYDGNIFKVFGELEHFEVHGSTSERYLWDLRDVDFLQNLKTVVLDSCSDMEEDEVMYMAERLTSIAALKKLELRHCQLKRSLLTKLEHLYPGKFVWDQGVLYSSHD